MGRVQPRPQSEAVRPLARLLGVSPRSTSVNCARALASALALLLAGPAALAPSAPVCAQEQSVRPGINRYYQDPEFEVWVQRFERAGREVYDQRHAIVAASGVARGMDVADVGAGTGLFTRLFAEAVGAQGTVYAVDISRPFIEGVLRRSRERGQDNVRGVVNTPRSVSLPASSVDLVFICDTYHHFEYPDSTMRSVHDALRPEGSLVVIDLRRRPDVASSWVMDHVRADMQTVVREIEAAGFRLVEQDGLLRRNYFLRFKKQ